MDPRQRKLTQMDPTIKSLIKNILHASGIAPGLVRWRADSYVLMFHGVGDSSLPVASFEDILDMLARNFRFGTLEDLLATRRGHSRPMVCLTFDDGLRNNHTHAYPIL